MSTGTEFVRYIVPSFSLNPDTLRIEMDFTNGEESKTRRRVARKGQLVDLYGQWHLADQEYLYVSSSAYKLGDCVRALIEPVLHGKCLREKIILYQQFAGNKRIKTMQSLLVFLMGKITEHAGHRTIEMAVLSDDYNQREKAALLEMINDESNYTRIPEGETIEIRTGDRYDSYLFTAPRPIAFFSKYKQNVEDFTLQYPLIYSTLKLILKRHKVTLPAIGYKREYRDGTFDLWFIDDIRHEGAPYYNLYVHIDEKDNKVYWSRRRNRLTVVTKMHRFETMPSSNPISLKEFKRS